MLRSVMSSDDVARFAELAARHDAAFRTEPGIGPHHVLNLHSLVGRDDAFLELVDWPTTFPKVFGVLGWNIQLFHTQLIVTPPAPANAKPDSYGWHQDNNRMNLDFETAPPHPRVSVKVGYLLSDLPARGMGNMGMVRGSHLLGRPPGKFDTPPDGMCELTGEAGDAVLFDRRLWHAASTNCSDRARVFLTYGYSYRWLRPKSEMRVDTLLPGSDPVRRQLLGDAPSGANGYFDPQPEDVPLRNWMERNAT